MLGLRMTPTLLALAEDSFWVRHFSDMPRQPDSVWVDWLPFFHRRPSQRVRLEASMSFSLRGMHQPREFITMLSGVAATWPLATFAQQPAMPVIGLLSSVQFEARRAQLAAFHRGLREAGYVEGRTLPSNIVQRTINRAGYPPWRPIWWSGE